MIEVQKQLNYFGSGYTKVRAVLREKLGNTLLKGVPLDTHSAPAQKFGSLHSDVLYTLDCLSNSVEKSL